VQRVPVRIELDPQQLAEHPLRVGLSMHATVDLAPQGGAPLAGLTPASAAASAGVLETAPLDAPDSVDRMVRDIIAANLGTAPRR